MVSILAAVVAINDKACLCSKLTAPELNSYLELLCVLVRERFKRFEDGSKSGASNCANNASDAAGKALLLGFSVST